MKERGDSPQGQSCVIPPWSAPEPLKLLGAFEKSKISCVTYSYCYRPNLLPHKKISVLATQQSFYQRHFCLTFHIDS